ncbi:MAG: acyl carrier protein [Candidatus Eisenbacteria bacterium]|nr:acyl carrier protein [Candidatus Eisenbacteria bacterium]
MSDDVRARVAALFADVLQVEAPAGDARRGTLDAWDSVSHFRLVMEVEQAFGIALGDAEVTEIETLADLQALVERKLAAKGGA